MAAKRVRILMFVICSLIIGYFSWQAIGNTNLAIFFWVWAPITALAWGSELAYLFRRFPAQIMGSDAEVQKRYQSRVRLFWLVVFANFGLMLSVGNSPSFLHAEIVTLTVLLYNLFTLAWLQYDALRWFRWPRIERWFWATTIFWSSIALLFGAVTY
jgi:hypothetical protein